MVQFFKKTNFNFIGFSKLAIGISLAFVLVSIVFMFVHKGLNFSVDFAGGTLIQVKFEKPVRDDLGKIRSIVSDLGLGSPEVKTIGQIINNELQITVAKQESELTNVTNIIRDALSKDYPENSFDIRRVESVGPKIGGELKRDAIIATILSLIAILIYVGFRFNLPFGVASVIPLFHDVLITLGVFIIFDLEISLTFIAAIMTIVGYSLNDTIVIFDRIRENMRGGLKGRKFPELVNSSINQTLSRTINTSVTTLFVVSALYFIGSEAIKDFALAMLVGVIAGTYSTIYIASPILIFWHNKKPITK
ncbi:MAG: protein translocase subunit SecF [Fibrobacter sp.]|nr:protein translocase subunit SecF [Fibrobacter sp.]